MSEYVHEGVYLHVCSCVNVCWLTGWIRPVVSLGNAAASIWKQTPLCAPLHHCCD